jgi:hypothetical protein
LAQAARELARRGKLREAARALHQAALLSLTRRRGLAWKSELADWEWVAALGYGPELSEFTRLAQRLAYGVEPDQAGFAACERLYDRLVTAG